MKKALLIISIMLSGIFVFAQVDVIIADTLNTSEDPVYVIADQMPEFPGGDIEMRKFIAQNLNYPAEAQKNKIQGTVFARFVVSKNGKIGDVEIMRGVDPMLDAEVVRVLKSFPDFTPGKQGGKPVNVWRTVPVGFKLN